MKSEATQRAIMNIKIALLAIVCASVTGCTIVSGSSVVIGRTRPPIDPSLVRIARTAPPKYEEIAIISAKAGHDFRSEQGIMDSAIRRLKEEAAKVGANCILLEGVQNRSDPTLVTSFGTATAYGPSGFASASGTSIGVASGGRYGHVKGIAIYIPEKTE